MKKFILWDPRDGIIPIDIDTGAIRTDGILGRITENNAYLTAYPEYPEEEKKLADLKVGECIIGVRYRLSGGNGWYDIYRVE